MAKSVTSWNSSSKGTSPWATVTKSGSAWVNNVVKNQTSFTVTPRTPISWANESMQLTPYMYDSVTVTYDNSYTYDYLQMVTNTTNNKNVTGWTS
jgi:hypothetical protein